MDTFEVIVRNALAEVELLMAGSLKGDAFLAEVKEVLSDCTDSNYCVPDNRIEQLRLLGRAAIRQFDSFDYVPEAERFVSLATDLSKTVDLNICATREKPESA